MAASEQLKWTWDWPHRTGRWGGGGGVGWEKERYLVLPSHHQQVGIKEHRTWNNSLPRHRCIVRTPSCCDQGVGEQGGRGGGVEEGSGLRWRRDKVEQREKRATQQVEEETWVVTNYSVAQDRSRVEGVSAGGVWNFWEAALMCKKFNSTTNAARNRDDTDDWRSVQEAALL